MTNLTYHHCRLLKGAWIVARTYHLVHLGIMWKPVPTGECFNLSYMFACIQGDCYTCNHKWHNYDGIHLNVVLFIIGQLQNFYQVSSSDWHLKGSNDNSYINNWTDWFFFLYAVNATNKNYHLLCWVITRKVLNILQHQGLHAFLSVENIFLCTLVFDLLVTLRLIWILGLHQPCSQTLSKKNNRMAWYQLFVHVCEILANNTLLCYRLTGSLFFLREQGYRKWAQSSTWAVLCLSCAILLLQMHSSHRKCWLLVWSLFIFYPFIVQWHLWISKRQPAPHRISKCQWNVMHMLQTNCKPDQYMNRLTVCKHPNSPV